MTTEEKMMCLLKSCDVSKGKTASKWTLRLSTAVPTVKINLSDLMDDELKLKNKIQLHDQRHIFPYCKLPQCEPQSSWLTSVLCAQPQHEADGEDLGPGRFPLLYQDAEEVGRVGQQQVLQRLEGGADVEEAAMLFAAQEALREEWVTQVAQHVAFRRRGRRGGEEERGKLVIQEMWGRGGGGGEERGGVGEIGEGKAQQGHGGEGREKRGVI